MNIRQFITFSIGFLLATLTLYSVEWASNLLHFFMIFFGFCFFILAFTFKKTDIKKYEFEKKRKTYMITLCGFSIISLMTIAKGWLFTPIFLMLPYIMIMIMILIYEKNTNSKPIKTEI